MEVIRDHQQGLRAGKCLRLFLFHRHQLIDGVEYLLLDSGLTDDAETILAYAVSIGTDVSHTYYALAKIYAGRKEYDKIADLIQRAEGLRSALRNSIVRTLQESYPQACSPHCG